MKIKFLLQEQGNGGKFYMQRTKKIWITKNKKGQILAPRSRHELDLSDKVSNLLMNGLKNKNLQ